MPHVTPFILAHLVDPVSLLITGPAARWPGARDPTAVQPRSVVR
jgi:hypothetical protein